MAILSPDGLCLACAGTPNTPDPTPFVPSDPLSAAPTASFGPGLNAGRESFAPTNTFLPEAPTVTAPTADGLPLPTPPAGYEFLKRLGGGGMGVVYLAREQASQRLVAMKFLRHPGDQTALDRFVTELRALAKLDHPNIVRVYGHDFLRADPYFTMEYAPGGSLSRAVKGTAPPAEAVRLIRVVAGAIAAAHAGDVIHRDLKPSNILLAADGTPKVADFGLAKQLDQLDSLTRASGALGTPSYMPPEQVSQKLGKIGPWSDVYGMGATLYHLLTGRAPFTGDSPDEIIQQVRADAPTRPRAANPAVPAALEAVVLRCLEKKPENRYQSVADFVADLDRYEAGQKPDAPELTRARRARLWAGAHRGALAVAAAVALLVGGAFVLGAAYWRAPGPADPTPAPVDPVDPRDEARRELVGGGPAPLLDARGYPRAHKWRLGTAALGPSPVEGDESVYFDAAGVALLEFIDDPGTDRYRLLFDVRYLGSRPASSGWAGVYVGLTEPGGAAVARHYGIVLREVSARTETPPNEARLKLIDVTWTRQPNSVPVPQVREFFTRELGACPDRVPPWRTLIVDVSPEALRFGWKPDPNGPEEPLAALVRTESGKFLLPHTARPNRPASTRDVPPGWGPRLSLGLCSLSSAVAFKNVRITPHP